MPRSTKPSSDDLTMAESQEAERFQGLKAEGEIDKSAVYYDQTQTPEEAFDIVEDPDEAAARARLAKDGDTDEEDEDDAKSAVSKSDEDDEQAPTTDSGATLNPVLVEQAKSHGFTDDEIALFQSDAALAVAVLRTNGKSAEETLDKLGTKDEDGKFTLANRENYDEEFADALEGAINGVRAEIKPLKEANARLTEQLEQERAASTAQWLDSQLEARGEDAVKLFGRDMGSRGEGTKERKNYVTLLQEINTARKLMGNDASAEDVLDRVLAFKFEITSKSDTRKAIREKLKERQTTLTQRTTSKRASDLPKGRERAKQVVGEKMKALGLDDSDEDDDLESFL